MAEVLQSPSLHPSSSTASTPKTSSSSCEASILVTGNNRGSPSSFRAEYGDGDSDSTAASVYDVEEGKEKDDRSREHLSLLAILFALFKKSLLSCGSDRRELCAMEIGWPTDVRHVAHVTFDRFHGFLGLPVELEPEVPRRAPSASASVFGVSTESMQLSYDSQGNSVPTVLLLMQNQLYIQRGLQAEGIFRINAENGQGEYVRDQLNRGSIPEGIDVHCLAGLIKAWFRELPTGVLDSLSPEQVMQSQTEEECAELARHLPATEAALLNWAINLMADVVQHEHLNKMNARNIAMVFAPNMTQMADPLTALMYAVQVMNFLKTLIVKTLREREESVTKQGPASSLDLEPSDENGQHSPSKPIVEDTSHDSEEIKQTFTDKEPAFDGSPDCNRIIIRTEGSCNTSAQVDSWINEVISGQTHGAGDGTGTKAAIYNSGQSNTHSLTKTPKKNNAQQALVQVTGPMEKTRREERIEAWW